MSTPDRLTDEEREELFQAGSHHPEHCACSAYVIEQAFAEDDCCQDLLDTFAAVERILAARLAAQPPATDRDALTEGECGEPRVTLTEKEARQVIDALGWDWEEEPDVPSVEDAAAEVLGAVAEVVAARLAAQSPGECGSCGVVPEGDCPKSRRACGHHCNHVWTHDHCDWCGAEFTGDDNAARPAPDTLADRVQALDGESLIAAERRRQVEQEGYSPEHDDAHGWRVLHHAAMHYLGEEGYSWPWAPGAYKPTDAVRDTIKAGALAQAAVEVAERGGVEPLEFVAARVVRRHCVRALDGMLDGVRALLAGRSDASPEGGA